MARVSFLASLLHPILPEPDISWDLRLWVLLWGKERDDEGPQVGPR